MKQVAQRSRDGSFVVVDAPLPALRPGWVLVQNRASLISAGTERSKVVMGQKSLAQKARARPDLVKQVVDRARDQGIRSTVAAVRDRLDALTPIGYSSSGVVLAVGAGVEGLAPGDRVACGGGGWASHAEVVCVPKNLVARLPDGVSFEAGAYATVGAIALHGLRQSEATVGEVVGVIGLGLVGQLACSLGIAAGLGVVGIDPDPQAVELAVAAGAQAFAPDAPGLAQAISRSTQGRGLDAVLICAASSTPAPVAQAAELARDRGRLVVVGDVPIEIDRTIAYDKELEVRLARSYGPGRYDREYEEGGRDLPAGYVRWTEQRNIQAFVDLAGSGRLSPERLTTHRFPIEQAPEAYGLLSNGNGARRPFGIVLEYGETAPEQPAPAPHAGRRVTARESVGVAFLGSGNFARATLIPAFAAAGARLVTVASRSGLTANDAAGRLGFERAAASVSEAIQAEDVDAVVVATRHSSHAELAVEALQAGKAVFVEKPLAVTEDQLDLVEAALQPQSVLMVGFNRRFAPLVTRLGEALGGRTPEGILIRVNAGALPADHWLRDPEDGGGRLVGEGCHFVDLAIHLARSAPVSVSATGSPPPDGPVDGSDTFGITIRFDSGTTAQVLYTGAGDTRLGKERIEVFGGGLSAVIDDFRRLELYAERRRTRVNGNRDKGHRAQVAAFVDAVAGRQAPPDWRSYVTAMRATFAAVESLRTGRRSRCASAATASHVRHLRHRRARPTPRELRLHGLRHGPSRAGRRGRPDVRQVSRPPASAPAARDHRSDTGRRSTDVASSGRWWITYNGELYNFQHLRRELEQRRASASRLSCDTEVLLRMFVVGTAQRCSAASTGSTRSRSGTTKSGASSSRATASASSRSTTRSHPAASRSPRSSSRCFRCWARRRLDPTRRCPSISTFLWVPDPRTAFADVMKLPPGHYAWFERGELRVEQYWDLRFQPEERSEQEWALQTHAERRQPLPFAASSWPTFPSGSFLSGGIDSSAVVAAMARDRQRHAPTRSGSRRGSARTTSSPTTSRRARGGSSSTPTTTSASLAPDVLDLLPHAVWHLEEPLADPAAISTYLICREAGQDMKVMLSGVGGDEVFGGYPRYLAWHLAQLGNRLPRSALHALDRLLGPIARPGGGGRLRGPRRNLWKFRRAMGMAPKERYLSYSTYYTEAELRDAVSERLAATLARHDPTATHRGYLEQQVGGDTFATAALSRREDVPPVPESDLHGQDVDGRVRRGARAAAR